MSIFRHLQRHALIANRVYSTNRMPSLFERILSKENVIDKESIRSQYVKDEGHFVGILPELVLFPETVEEVSAVLKICNKERIPVIPIGTGTGLEGGIIHRMPGVSMDLSKIRGDITDISWEDSVASVRPSVTRSALNKSVRNQGLFFPVDPGADASLCGMAATGASGTNAVRYGTMKENVLNLEVVLPDGTVVNTRGKGKFPRKSSAGFNLTELFVGSEGTLGVITEATLKLHPLPQSRSVAIVPFESIHNAVEAVVQVLQYGINVAKIEIMDDVQVAACNAYSKLSLTVAPTLFFEFHGFTDEETESQRNMTERICLDNGASSFVPSVDEKHMENLWKARHNAYYAALSLRKGSKGFTTDVCVPISKLAQAVTLTKEDLVQSNLIGPIVGHIGDGNFHVILPIVDEEQEMPRVLEFAQRLVQRALTFDGTCTGEHGIGLGKKQFLVQEVGGGAIKTMQLVKQSLDPYRIMNPGKVID